MSVNVNYRKIIGSITDNDKRTNNTLKNTNTLKNEKIEKYKFIDYKIHKNINKKEKFLSRNQVPKNNKWVSYETWEHIYFDNIIDISEILLNSSRELELNIQNKTHFIDSIGNFLFNCSSGEITNSYELTNNDTYNEFTIKRQNLYNKNGEKESH